MGLDQQQTQCMAVFVLAEFDCVDAVATAVSCLLSPKAVERADDEEPKDVLKVGAVSAEVGTEAKEVGDEILDMIEVPDIMDLRLFTSPSCVLL
jgi:hypothetical protein